MTKLGEREKDWKGAKAEKQTGRLEKTREQEQGEGVKESRELEEQKENKAQWEKEPDLRSARESERIQRWRRKLRCALWRTPPSGRNDNL
mmetsp:Transcript_34556/g.55895  ORF Transcript_34556/g.55895 Transcript_34556/m.55895 type:complete len:90 (-) Transcript_34556:349-618(-)